MYVCFFLITTSLVPNPEVPLSRPIGGPTVPTRWAKALHPNPPGWLGRAGRSRSTKQRTIRIRRGPRCHAERNSALVMNGPVSNCQSHQHCFILHMYSPHAPACFSSVTYTSSDCMQHGHQPNKRSSSDSAGPKLRLRAEPKPFRAVLLLNVCFLEM